MSYKAFFQISLNLIQILMVVITNVLQKLIQWAHLQVVRILLFRCFWNAFEEASSARVRVDAIVSKLTTAKRNALIYNS